MTAPVISTSGCAGTSPTVSAYELLIALDYPPSPPRDSLESASMGPGEPWAMAPKGVSCRNDEAVLHSLFLSVLDVVPNAKRSSARSRIFLSYNEPEVVRPGLHNLRKMIREEHKHVPRPQPVSC